MESELIASENDGNRMLFKSESLLEDKKWDAPGQDEGDHYTQSRRSSNGGFFYGKKKGGKEDNMEFSATIDIFEQKIRIKLDDAHRAANQSVKEIIKDFNLRDVLSARQDQEDKRILHLWTFKKFLQKKGCCKKTEHHPRRLEDFALIGLDEKKTADWANIIQCAIEGVSFEHQMPEKRKILVLVNPFSGRRLAARNWEIAKPILEKAHIDMKVIMTERAGHAYDIVNQEIKLGDYDGIVTVSGDGLIHEVVNGLYRRTDCLQLMSTLNLGFIPGGSANGLVKAVLAHAEEEYSVESSAFLVAKGRSMRMDLTEIEAEYQTEKIYSFLSTFWGVLADCDINSEVLRCLGHSRFTLWGVFRVFCMKRYAGSLYFNGKKFDNKNELAHFNEDNLTPDLPEFHEEPVRHQEDPGQYRDAIFSYVLVQNTPFIGSQINSGPLSHINDGYNDIITQTANQGRVRLANILIQQDDGTYFNQTGQLKESLGIDYIKCKTWRIDPLAKAPRPVTQAEKESEKNNISQQENSTDQKNQNVQEEDSKETGASNPDKNGRVPSTHSQYSLSLQQQLLDKKSDKTYRIDEHAFYSIDGEKYPAQKIQGRVLKGALPIYY